jgi:hypothetical protein
MRIWVMQRGRLHCCCQWIIPVHGSLQWRAVRIPLRIPAGSNLGPETCYPDWGSPWYSSVPPDTAVIVPQFRPRPLPFISLPIHHSSSSHSTLYIVWVTENASLSKQYININKIYIYMLAYVCSLQLLLITCRCQCTAVEISTEIW